MSVIYYSSTAHRWIRFKHAVRTADYFGIAIWTLLWAWVATLAAILGPILWWMIHR